MAFIQSRKKFVSSAIVSSLSVIAGQSFAQESITQEQVTQLETIHSEAAKEKSLKVDASKNKKFVAPLLDTPKSVSVISQQLIQDTQVTTLADALRNVPGITLGAGEGGTPNGDRPIIRGYNSESSMYVDGVRSATSQNREMFAVEQVEVTKGSASTMGGAGTTGGSINTISKIAKKGDSIEGSVAAGTDHYARITLDANKDFGNGVAARVAVLGHQNDKPGQHDGADYARVGVAPSITFGLDSDTRATLSYYYLRTDDNPDSGIPYWDPKAQNSSSGKPADVKQGTYYGWKDRDFQKQENQIGTLKLEHDFNDNLTLSNTVVFSNSKNDTLWTNPDDSKGNLANGHVARRANSRITDTDAFTDQLSLTGKFKTGLFNHRFNAGAEYSKQDSDKDGYTISDLGTTYTTLPNLTSLGGVNLGASQACANANASNHNFNNICAGVIPNTNDPFYGSITKNNKITSTSTENTSVYFLDSIELNPKWILDLGLRWDDFKTEQSSNTSTTRIKSKDDFFNYQAGLTFKPLKNGAIYGSYATSSNPVGVDAGDGSESVSEAIKNLKPEEVRTFELGTKWDLLNEKLALTAAIFRTEKTNTRATDENGNSQNIGESRVDGFELGLNGNITDKWAVSAGYSYLDSELVDAGFTNIETDRNKPAIYAPSKNNGKQVQNVAKNSATLWTTYQILPQLQIGAGAIAMDKVYGNADNTKYVPGYVRYDAMARYNVNKNVNVQLNINNLSDVRYFSRAFTSHYATEADGRNAVIAVNFKY